MTTNAALKAPIYPETSSAIDDPRLADMILRATEANLRDADVVILGIPTDEGIRRNGGRIGASEAPNAIRHWLGKLTPYAGPLFQDHLQSLRIVDLGDVAIDELETMHDVAARTVADLAERGKIVITLGGGHDITYPAVRGWHEGLGKRDIGLINVDAHLDVRPKKHGLHHSGSSFRLLLEEGVVRGRQFAEIGIQSFSASEAHVDWLMQQGSRLLTFEDATNAELPNAFEECAFAVTHGDAAMPVYLSIDIDSIRASDAPGVSAPSPMGFLAEEAYELAVAAGLAKNVGAIDIVELSPPHDVDGRTARLAARMIAGFLAGVANRKHR